MSHQPKLLCATGPFYMMPLPRALEAIARAGFDGIEVMATGEEASRDPATLRALAADHGLTVRAIHAPFLLLTRRVFSTDPLEKIRRSVALAQDVGAGIVIVHPAYRWQIRYASWLHNDLEDFCAKEATTVAVENMFPVRLRGRAATFHRTIGIEEMRSFPAVTLDTSHLAVSGIDILTAFDELADRISHIHLSNNLGTGVDSHSPLREGVLPIGAFIEKVGASGYSGSITIEVDVRAWSGRPAQLAASLRENRDYCAERLAAATGA
ncbi:MAG: sugar phosphate isomerase/epimerase [Acidobacteria bacterium]|nr:sugar phosphate isomerase/epimerase [Acidobacteriota bacterium]